MKKSSRLIENTWKCSWVSAPYSLGLACSIGKDLFFRRPKVKKNPSLRLISLYSQIPASSVDLPISLSSNKIKSKIVITEDEIKEFYQKHKEEYVDACEVKLARCFLKARNPNDKQEIAQITELGNEMLKNLDEGYSFEELAKK